MSDVISGIVENIDPKIVLDALHGHLGTRTKESDEALEYIAKEFEKSGIDCGPKGCRLGFVQRQLMNYAGAAMVRSLHQKISLQNGSDSN